MWRLGRALYRGPVSKWGGLDSPPHDVHLLGTSHVIPHTGISFETRQENFELYCICVPLRTDIFGGPTSMCETDGGQRADRHPRLREASQTWPTTSTAARIEHPRMGPGTQAVDRSLPEK